MSLLFRAVLAVAVLLVLVSAIWSSIYSSNQHQLFHTHAKRSAAVLPSRYRHLTHDPADNRTWKPLDSLLVASTDGQFYLNHAVKRLISGEFHYFRTHPAQWDDRLRRLRSAGLNTVCTRVPWNLHERRRGSFEFDGFWNLTQFIRTVDNLGFLLIVHVGPYIDSDWEFGGLPYWLLHDPDMVVRSSIYPPYINYVERYLGQLLPLLARFTYRRHGPIIAVQVENELGSYTADPTYIQSLVKLVRQHGIDELVLIADRADHLTTEGGTLTVHNSATVTLPARTLRTVTCVDDVRLAIDNLRSVQPRLPVLVTVYTAGAVSRWGEPHSPPTSVETFRRTVDSVLQSNASVNVYAFAGGTNFGLWNGALDNVESQSVSEGALGRPGGSRRGAGLKHRTHRQRLLHRSQVANRPAGLAYRPVTTSYSYDAPVSEFGHIHQSSSSVSKYEAFRRLLLDRELISRLQDAPRDPPDSALGLVRLDELLTWSQLVARLEPPIILASPVFMERLNVQFGNGQGYGWILYRTSVPLTSSGVVNVTGVLRDRALFYVDGRLVSTVYSYKVGDFSVVFNVQQPSSGGTSNTSRGTGHGHRLVLLDILVENMGRANFGLLDDQRKGFVGRVSVDGVDAVDLQWEHFSLDFSNERVVDALRRRGPKHDWMEVPAGRQQLSQLAQPNLHRGQFKVRQPKDTFLDMSQWTKGVVVLNGFVLGRYWSIGPQQALYVPAPLIVRGVNELIVFELERSAVNGKVKFVSRPDQHHHTVPRGRKLTSS